MVNSPKKGFRPQKGVRPQHFIDNAANSKPRVYARTRTGLIINLSKIRTFMKTRCRERLPALSKNIRIGPAAVIFTTGVTERYIKELLQRIYKYKPKVQDSSKPDTIKYAYLASMCCDGVNDDLHKFAPNTMRNILDNHNPNTMKDDDIKQLQEKIKKEQQHIKDEKKQQRADKEQKQEEQKSAKNKPASSAAKDKTSASKASRSNKDNDEENDDDNTNAKSKKGAKTKPVKSTKLSSKTKKLK